MCCLYLARARLATIGNCQMLMLSLIKKLEASSQLYVSRRIIRRLTPLTLHSPISPTLSSISLGSPPSLLPPPTRAHYVIFTQLLSVSLSLSLNSNGHYA